MRLHAFTCCHVPVHAVTYLPVDAVTYPYMLSRTRRCCHVLSFKYLPSLVGSGSLETACLSGLDDTKQGVMSLRDQSTKTWLSDSTSKHAFVEWIAFLI